MNRIKCGTEYVPELNIWRKTGSESFIGLKGVKKKQNSGTIKEKLSPFKANPKIKKTLRGNTNVFRLMKRTQEYTSKGSIILAKKK